MAKAKLTLVKIGGNIIDNPPILSQFLEDFSMLEGLKILIHGGGKEATRLAGKLNVETIMIEGRRVTNEEMLDVTVMTYAGLCNKKITAQLQGFGTQAVGLTGADGNSIKARKRPHTEIDYGFVGDVIEINSTWISDLLQTGATPVFCAITHDGNGQLLNTNADTIAQSIAVGLSEFYDISLIYCFEKKGVLQNTENENSVIQELNYNTYQTLKNESKIHSGMIPKLDNCFKAIEQGVKEIKIASAEIISQPKIIHTNIKL